MSRASEYSFIPTDPEDVIIWMTAAYEELTGVAVRPASPEQLFIRWMADVIVLERVLTNYAGNQNIPSRAVGENLDALAELFYIGERPGDKAASCTMRFTISEPQGFAVLIPKGTRVTDASRTLAWATLEDIYVNVGESYADIRVQCQTTGRLGNGYVAGQINSIVDAFPYFLSCENLTESDGGADAATDEEFYELMRASMDGYSCAGSLGGYAYFAKQVSTEIADVVPNSPSPGVVYIYVLMGGGRIAGEEIKKAVFEACSGETVRAFTDDVHMGDPEVVPYDIDLTFYVREDSTASPREAAEKVDAAVEQFIQWQSGRLGRDINPSKLYHLLMETGVKRVDLRAPAFTPLRDGKLALGQAFDNFAATVPQVAQLRKLTVLNGGYEDE